MAPPAIVALTPTESEPMFVRVTPEEASTVDDPLDNTPSGLTRVTPIRFVEVASERTPVDVVLFAAMIVLEALPYSA